MVEYRKYPYAESDILRRIEQYKKMDLQTMTEQEAYRFILSVIDLTTLEGSDNAKKINDLCATAIHFKDNEKNIPSTASVCVYPPFVHQANTLLKNTDILVASVAGGFPAGQTPIEIKLAEVKYAVESGADEIDMVISRGKFLEGNYQEVFDEIAAIKNVCGAARLKVILETGELQSADNIYAASWIAMCAGADFIKTSTGKFSVNATPEFFLIMLDAIKNYYKETGKMTGMKPAGGISDPDTALLYVKILENVLGKNWLNKKYFRIGASRLAQKIAEKIK
ncbi:MAG: deoxyribose-phosphate aldolase [Bacteroidales bacterium]|nr:deoxyribose-phosphate aldolase [Bacteroidales bacterium]